MKAASLSEDIVDDILADFPELRSRGNAAAHPKFTAQPSSAYDPVKIRGVEHESFSQWARSKDQVRLAIRDKLGSPKMSLENCIKLYTEHNIKIDDYVVLEFPTHDVYPYREYDRELKNGWTGKMDQDEYIELMSDIKRKGIQQPGVLDIVNLKDGLYEAYLGEGNHRLKIAMALGIKQFPITFYYRFA
jgi:hypothetical protein